MVISNFRLLEGEEKTLLDNEHTPYESLDDIKPEKSIGKAWVSYLSSYNAIQMQNIAIYLGKL